MTVGTGIGGGVVANGRLVHGLVHPEIGHMLIPHDRTRDPFAGACPFHADCFEGLASGTALRARWGRAGEELDGEREVWALEAEYLALGVVNITCAVSPQCVIVGGGVMKQSSLLPLVRERVSELLAGYVDAPELALPALGDRSGVVGALELARGYAGSASPARYAAARDEAVALLLSRAARRSDEDVHELARVRQRRTSPTGASRSAERA